jgi:hypothetical protein
MTLHEKIRDVLARLETLSEAGAGNLEAQISKSAPESSPPAGGLIDTDRSAGTIRDRSLHDWYRTQFANHAENPERLLSLYLAAEREYLRRTVPDLHRRTAEKGSILAYSQDGAAVEGIAALQVIEEFEGVHALDVAIIEGKTEAWVIKVRRQHGRDPQDGRLRSPFHGWDEDRRRQEVASLARDDLGAKAIGKRLGVDKNTIKRYLPQPEQLAA